MSGEPKGGLKQDRLVEEWRRLNVRYFRNRLPAIAIEWSPHLTASAGLFVSYGGPRTPPRGEDGTSRPRRMIRLSIPLLRQQPEQEIIGTLAHEMIHQWQFDVLKRRPNHGADFRRMMAAMNRDGLGVTINHALDHVVRSLARYAWRCEQCGMDYRRQRRTIRPGRHRCGSCRGRLTEVTLREPPRASVDEPVRAPARRPAAEPAVQLGLPF